MVNVVWDTCFLFQHQLQVLNETTSPQVLKTESCSTQILLYRWLIQCQFHSKTLCSNFWIIHIESWVARTDKDVVCRSRQNTNLCKAASFMKQTWTVTRLERKDKKRDYGISAFCFFILNGWINMTTELVTDL